VRSRPLRWNAGDPYRVGLLPLYKQLLQLRDAHPALRSRNFYPPNWQSWMTQLDSNGFGIDTSRKLVIYHRWSDDGKELFYIALNFSDQDQMIDLQFARNGVYRDVLNGNGMVTVAGNRATLKLESNWGHVYFQCS